MLLLHLTYIIGFTNNKKKKYNVEILKSFGLYKYVGFDNKMSL